MKVSKFSEAQKAFILKQGKDGLPVADLCRKAGISQATYFNWKKKYDGLLPTEMRRLKQLEEQQAAQGRGRPQPRQGDAAGRDPPKTLRPARKRKLVDEVRGEWGVSIRRTCRVLEVDTSTYHYKSRLPRTGRSGGADQGDLPDAGALWEPPRARAAAPGGLAHQPQEGLSDLSRDGPAIAQQDAQAEGQGEAAGRPQGCHRTEPDLGDGLRPRSAGDRAEAAGADGGRYLLALLTGDRSALHVSRRGRGPDPGSGLRRSRLSADDPVDQGSEFVSRDLELWAYARGVTLDFSRPGKPTDNAFIEAFNGRFRAECLNAHWFMSLEDARQKMEAWRRYSNEERPHGAIGQKTPITLLSSHGTPSPPS